MRRVAAGLLLGMIAVAGCGGSDGPKGGEATLQLATGFIDTGAILLRITGAVDQVTPAGNYRVASAPVGTGAVTRVVVTGEIGPGDLFRIRVPDVSKVSGYGVAVEQAASRTDFSLLDPSSFTVTIRTAQP